jgi:hypothetical protein
MSGRKIVERLARLSEKRDFDREFWREAGPQARFEAAWEMVKEVERIRGQVVSEHRLQRTVEHLYRRKP